MDSVNEGLLHLKYEIIIISSISELSLLNANLHLTFKPVILEVQDNDGLQWIVLMKVSLHVKYVVIIKSTSTHIPTIHLNTNLHLTLRNR